MNRKLRWSLLLFLLAAFAIWLEPTRVVCGWLRGEAFYEGRPTSYWERTLANWDELTLNTSGENWLELNFKASISAVSIRTETYPGSIRIGGTLRIKSQKNGWFATVRRWLTKGANKLEVDLVEVGLFSGDPQAAPVLRALAEQPVGEVRSLAEYGLRNIEIKAKQGP